MFDKNKKQCCMPGKKCWRHETFPIFNSEASAVKICREASLHDRNQVLSRFKWCQSVNVAMFSSVISGNLSLSVPVCTCLYLSVPVCTCLYLSVPVCTCLYLSAWLSVCLCSSKPWVEVGPRAMWRLLKIPGSPPGILKPHGLDDWMLTLSVFETGRDHSNSERWGIQEMWYTCSS